jgi:hypothetical protein
MVGRLEMDMDECITAYSDLTAAVFSGTRRSIPSNKKVDAARFHLTTLEDATRKMIENIGAFGDDLFNDGTERGCRT